MRVPARESTPHLLGGSPPLYPFLFGPRRRRCRRSSAGLAATLRSSPCAASTTRRGTLMRRSARLGSDRRYCAVATLLPVAISFSQKDLTDRSFPFLRQCPVCRAFPALLGLGSSRLGSARRFSFRLGSARLVSARVRQENFSVQLVGTKKWSVARATVEDPVTNYHPRSTNGTDGVPRLACTATCMRMHMHECVPACRCMPACRFILASSFFLSCFLPSSLLDASCRPFLLSFFSCINTGTWRA